MKPRAHRWLVWLLPFLVARALVPAGFMWSASAGELALTFCPSAGPVAQLVASGDGVAAQHQAHEHAASDHGHHAHHDPQGSNTDQHANHFGASDTGVCPFAVVSAACSGGDCYVANARLDSVTVLLPDYTVPPAANRSIHADRIRGPPASHTHS